MVYLFPFSLRGCQKESEHSGQLVRLEEPKVELDQSGEKTRRVQESLHHSPDHRFPAGDVPDHRQVELHLLVLPEASQVDRNRIQQVGSSKSFLLILY